MTRLRRIPAEVRIVLVVGSLSAGLAAWALSTLDNEPFDSPVAWGWSR